jgi:hypothetical protein
MAEQYFANKDKDMMAPKAKMAAKGPMRKVFVLPRKGQKEIQDVERMGREVKRMILGVMPPSDEKGMRENRRFSPMKTKEVVKTIKARQFSKAEKAMMNKAAKKLEGLVMKRAERAEARATKPLTLEEQNIKKQLEEKLKMGIEAAKSPEQKKMEKQMLLALEAPKEMKMMAIEAPKGKAGRPIKSTPGKEFMGMYDLTRADDSLVKLRQEAKEKGLSSSGTKETLIDRLKEYDFKKMEEEEARPKGQKQITSFFMPQLQEKQEQLVSEEESEAEPIVDAAAEVVADITGAPEIKQQLQINMNRAPLEPKDYPEEIAKIYEKISDEAKTLPQGKKKADALVQVYRFSYEPGSIYKQYIDKYKKFNYPPPVGTVLASKKKVKVTKRGKGLVGAGIVDFVSGLASKAIDHIKKDPIGAIKQAVSIGKSAFEHGQKAKEMYDKFFKGKDKGGMLSPFTEPEKRHMVHKIYHMNLFNTMMDQNPMSSSS